MANRRMLSKSISTSVQVNSLGIEEQLLFTWMIAHADDDGRMKGNAAYIKALVVPMKDWTTSKVNLLLIHIRDKGLIHYWEYKKNRYIELTGWKKHQKIRKDRYTQSDIPEYIETPTTTTGIPNDNQLATK